MAGSSGKDGQAEGDTKTGGNGWADTGMEQGAKGKT